MKKIVFLLSLFFIFLVTVNADECSASEKTKYMSDAVKVTASYEFKYDETGKPYFVITVYNLSQNLNIYYTSTLGNSGNIYTLDNQTESSFNDYNITDINKYTFSVNIYGESGCTSSAIKFNLVKPKKNYYYDNVGECKFEKMKDYYYCKEWISSDFLISDQTIRNNIKNEFNKTTTVISQESETESNLVTFVELFIKYKYYILGGIGIGIIIDIVYIYLSYKRIREGEF